VFYGPKPKKSVLVTPFRVIGADGRPEWHWDGAADSGVRHVVKLVGPVEQATWLVWLEDQLLAETTMFHRGRSEAEHYILWHKYYGMDAIGANRLLVANGYTASQHVFAYGCNCVACEIKETAV
jgi:hypothetical protein